MLILATEIEKKIEKMTDRTLTVRKNFFYIFSVISGLKQTVSKKLVKNFFRADWSFSVIFSNFFLSTVISGQFYVDPENLSP